MARWIQSRRRQLAADGRRRADSGDGEALTSTKTGAAARAAQTDAPTAGARLAALRDALAEIGNTLEEATTCGELTRAAVGLAGGTAATVLRRSDKTVSGYEAIAGDADALPDVRWATAVAREAGAPALGAPVQHWLEYAGAPHTRAALCLPLTSGEDTYGVLVWARSGQPLRTWEAELLSLLAERAASHIRHARAYETVNRTAGA
ncbi:GAF domain-containing protein, partial [Streptomyces broussonetiae]|uniref:GAF domain-containing protein n=1 Tax=Streptomyces broussonetiae TaxID=2686304 RepID=UPI0035E289DC